MRIICLLLGASVFFTSCYKSESGTVVSDQNQTTTGKRNHKYNLECVFHTMEVTAGNKIVDAVSIRDNNKAEEAQFEPTDPQSLLLGNGYTRNVSWSPDEEYLILPLGQFDGFCIIRSSEALKSVREKKCLETIRIQLKTGLRMSHEFATWDGSSAFVFTAGMERQFPRFRYEFLSRQLSALEKVNDIFEGFNNAGKLTVARSAADIASPSPKN